MARTSDPHAAALKAWESRERAKEGGGSEATTSRDDFAKKTDVDPDVEAAVMPIVSEGTTPAPHREFKPDVEADADGDGVSDAARVGVPANEVPPPPKVPRLPNLTREERAAESAFAEAFEKDPDGMAKAYIEMVKQSGSPKFEVDAAKNLFEAWKGEGLDPEKRAEIRSTLNTALHQTANAIAKRAFLMHLDGMSPEEKAKGMFVTVGGCGCHAPGTQIMLSDGTTRSVEDIRVGDRLMGPDSKPREVLRTIHGSGQMYRVEPNKGDPFVVNEDHVLSLMHWKSNSRGQGPQNICVRDVLRTREVRGRGVRPLLLHRVGVEYPPAPVPLNPYFLGLWLGDGTGINTTITTADPEVAAFVATMAESTPGVRLRVGDKKGNKAKGYHLVAAQSGRVAGGDYVCNPVLSGLRELGVSPERRDRNDGGNDQNGSRLKHIPNQYLHNSREVRLELLAGLLDSDGHLCNRACFDIITRWNALADGIAALVRSLGMACYVSPCRKRSQTGFEGSYYRLSISGDTHLIPTRIARKRAPVRRQKRNVLHTGFALQHLGEGGYYGFTLEGDGLYLLRDFTITHNSGKGFALKQCAKQGMPEFDAKKYGAVWDSAGDQNATENPWLLAEAKKRGIKVTFAYVSADPEVTWAGNDKRPGVIQRATDPNDARMVDADVFADSYVMGARNHAAFAKRHAKDASFLYVDSGATIKRLDGIPDSDLARSRRAVRTFALRTVAKLKTVPPRVKRGALAGQRIWHRA